MITLWVLLPSRTVSLIQQWISNYQYMSHFQAVIVKIPEFESIDWGEE